MSEDQETLPNGNSIIRRKKIINPKYEHMANFLVKENQVYILALHTTYWFDVFLNGFTFWSISFFSSKMEQTIPAFSHSYESYSRNIPGVLDTF